MQVAEEVPMHRHKVQHLRLYEHRHDEPLAPRRIALQLGRGTISGAHRRSAVLDVDRLQFIRCRRILRSDSDVPPKPLIRESLFARDLPKTQLVRGMQREVRFQALPRDVYDLVEEGGLLMVFQMLPEDHVHHRYEGPAVGHHCHRACMSKGPGQLRRTASDGLCDTVEQRHRPVIRHFLLVDQATVEDKAAEGRAVHAQRAVIPPRSTFPDVHGLPQEHYLTTKQCPTHSLSFHPMYVPEVRKHLLRDATLPGFILPSYTNGQKIPAHNSRTQEPLEAWHLVEEALELATRHVLHPMLLRLIHAPQHLLIPFLGVDHIFPKRITGKVDRAGAEGGLLRPSVCLVLCVRPEGIFGFLVLFGGEGQTKPTKTQGARVVKVVLQLHHAHLRLENVRPAKVHQTHVLQRTSSRPSQLLEPRFEGEHHLWAVGSLRHPGSNFSTGNAAATPFEDQAQFPSVCSTRVSRQVLWRG
mmetsp:Transcript_41814/g.110724  ORF Transcript_41814/g.110724 Transcript_41814/m.110724 type:complete len:470 (+) Transcript_41814:1832-3241(+)